MRELGKGYGTVPPIAALLPKGVPRAATTGRSPDVPWILIEAGNYAGVCNVGGAAAIV